MSCVYRPESDFRPEPDFNGVTAILSYRLQGLDVGENMQSLIDFSKPAGSDTNLIERTDIGQHVVHLIFDEQELCYFIYDEIFETTVLLFFDEEPSVDPCLVASELAEQLHP